MNDSVRESEMDGEVPDSSVELSQRAPGEDVIQTQQNPSKQGNMAQKNEEQPKKKQVQIQEAPDKVMDSENKNVSKDGLIVNDDINLEIGQTLSDKKIKEGDGEKEQVVLPIEVDDIEVKEAIDALAYKKSKTKAEQSIIALEEKVNYIELMAHIENTHPTLEVQIDQGKSKSQSIHLDEAPKMPFKYFPLCENIGTLCPGFPCCQKNKPSPMSQQLGLGPTLFLMSTKAFAWFFLVLTILNIPVILFFGSGNAAKEYQSFPDLFAIVSMGNVGQSDFTCGSMNYKELYQKNPLQYGYGPDEQMDEYERNSNIDLNCGIGSKINGLLYVGIGKNKSSNCRDILSDPINLKQSFKDDCYYESKSKNDLFTYSPAQQTIVDMEQVATAATFDKIKDQNTHAKELECVKNLTEGATTFDFYDTWFQCYCVGNSYCQIPGMTKSQAHTYTWDYETSQTTDVSTNEFMVVDRFDWTNYRMNDKCFNKMKDLSKKIDEKPQLMVVASCESPKIVNPFNEEQQFKKDEFGVLIVFFDMGTVILVVIFAELLNSSQEDYAKSFNLQTIEMIDFTLRVKNLPHHEKYYDKDDVLRAVISHHFQEIIKDEMKLIKQQAELLDENDEIQKDFDNLTDIDPQKDGKEVEAMDYEVADVNFGKGNMKEMEYLQELSNYQTEQTRNYIRKTMMQDQLNEEQLAKIENEENQLNDKFVKTRDIYIEYQKEKLAQMENEELRHGGDPEVRYAYVTFRSKDAIKLVKQSYKRYGACTRFWVMNCCCKGCCKNEREELKKKYIFQRYPEITEACQPDNINWHNLGYGNNYRSFMKLINWLIAIVMICISLYLVILLKQEVTRLKQEYNINVVCPQRSGTEEFKSIAWNDQQLDQTKRMGLMHCFCFKKMVSIGPLKVRDIKFEEFPIENKDTKKMEPDTSLYCDEWFFNYGFQQSAVVGTSLVVVVINVIASTVLTITVGIEKSHTVNDETMGQFQKLTILQFINIAIIILIINFNLTSVDENTATTDGVPEQKLFLGFLPFFNGEFDDFSSEWFGQIGKTLTLTLLINIFTPHISKLTLPFLKLLKRCLDRRCSCQIWKKKKDQNDTDVNTKLLIQSDLNELYTGEQIQSHFVYAQNYTYLCVVLMYSTGLPILYPFAATFYCVLYWVYKGLMLKYYARTTKFNQEIPIQSMAWVKFGIFAHLFIGSLMLSNHDFFPAENEEGDSVYGELINDTFSGFFIVDYFERLQAGKQSALYLAFVVIMFLIWISKTVINLLLNFCPCVQKPIRKMISCVLGVFTMCCKRPKEEIESKDIYKEFNVQSLELMYKKAKEDLEDFKANMEKGNSITYKQHRFPQEVEFEATTIVDMHQRRVDQIRNVIDSHLIHLHGKWNLNKFDVMNTEQKLYYLLHKQQLIDKEQRMRMVDITQSYNILDSEMFKKTKLVQDKIEENENYNLLGVKAKLSVKQ